jgi:NADP-dependent 3-hydroxy acid dehydrogenase YdfG
MTDLKDKNVLITGAASGIGRLMAMKIAALGGRMILWDVNREALTKLCGELEGRGLAVKAIHSTSRIEAP